MSTWFRTCACGNRMMSRSTRCRDCYAAERADVRASFEASVTRGPDDACWEWTGAHKSEGYGLIASGGRQVRAHRVSWEIHFGPIPAGMFVCHRCDNPPCVNPAHLFLGSPRDNVLDMHAKGRARPAPPFGEAASNVRATEASVLRMRALRAGGMTYPAIAAEVGYSVALVSQVCKRRTWRHLP